MKIEFTVEEIRAFVGKQYQSVSARYVKAALQHYDALLANPKEPETVHGNEAEKEVCKICNGTGFYTGHFGVKRRCYHCID